jgi:predicted secreted Zn-dependent protease
MLKNTQEDLKNSEIYCNKLYEKNSNHIIKEKTNEKNFKNKIEEINQLNLKIHGNRNEDKDKNENENENEKMIIALKMKIIALEKTVEDFNQISDGELYIYISMYVYMNIYLYI